MWGLFSKKSNGLTKEQEKKLKDMPPDETAIIEMELEKSKSNLDTVKREVSKKTESVRMKAKIVQQKIEEEFEKREKSKK